MDSGDRAIGVLPIADLPPGAMTIAEVDGVPILLVNVAGDVHAVQGTCSHEGYQIGEDDVDGANVTCFLHQSEFDVRTGEVLSGPAELPLAKHRVEIRDGSIILLLPPGPIQFNES